MGPCGPLVESVLNPATLLGLWLAFIIALPVMGPPALLLATLMGAVALFRAAVRRRFLHLLRRTRLLLLLLLLAHAWTTPGEPLGPHLPSGEGLYSGFLYALRLLLMLISLAWLLDRLTQEELLGGLYLLLRPLGRLGFPVERFVVRLALVLGDGSPRAVPLKPQTLLGELKQTAPAGPGEVVVDLPPFGWRDGVAGMAAGLLLLLILAAQAHP